MRAAAVHDEPIDHRERDQHELARDDQHDDAPRNRRDRLDRTEHAHDE